MSMTRATMRGPIFDGRAAAAVDALLDEAVQEVADDGVNVIRQELGRVLRHPTGHYESRIQTERAKADAVITDGGIIYGPWLEGVSARNQSTRFKGYATFRRMTQQIDRKAPSIVQRLMPRFLSRMQ